MADVNVSLNFSGIPESVSAIHVHVEYAHELASSVYAIGDQVSELSDAVTGVTSQISSILTNTEELMKDVTRLIEQGNTDAAVAALNDGAAQLAEANQKLADIDTAVENASPETPAPAEPQPVDTASPSTPQDVQAPTNVENNSNTESPNTMPGSPVDEIFP